MVIKELEQLGSKQSPYKRSIVLIRHGTTQWNVEKKYLGHTDMGLLPDAQEELAQLREQCRELIWDAVYCSDLLRCRQTLAHIAPQLIEQAKFDSRLRENDFGQWEGLNYEQLKDNSLYRSWIDDPQKVIPPEGESWQTFAERMDSFLHEQIWSEHSHKALIVTHGGVIRYMMSRLINGVGFWDTHVIPGQAIQVQLEKQGDYWLGRRMDFPYIGL
ncbi:histidine phosphatase family protein [Paenibacillus polysaccharolyticus]|uniref:histidine phosphatase family protein n=1 Tax=Paenibacillus polysaccharolyticus TaxID=582692 RepID=UPI00203A736E|nr:histidine phosphatase family protein [Paenibacillus polysaccharolyticus]